VRYRCYSTKQGQRFKQEPSLSSGLFYNSKHQKKKNKKNCRYHCSISGICAIMTSASSTKTMTTGRAARINSTTTRRRHHRLRPPSMVVVVGATVLVALLRRMMMISALLLFVAMVQAADTFENSTTVTLKNTRIAAPGVQQVQGKILYDNGYVDLSKLVFSLVSTTTKNDGDGGDESSSSANSNNEDETVFYMDLAILEVPKVCNNVTQQCDWAEAWTLGVSIPSHGPKNRLGEPELWWCCTQNAMDHGACTMEQYGRLLINETLFHGQRAAVPIPDASTQAATAAAAAGVQDDITWSLPMEDAGFGFTQAGMYTLILANCNADAANPATASGIFVNGDTVWTSFNEMEIVQQAIPFYIILGMGYAILLTWFWYLLQNNKSSRIKLEEWIFATIGLGFLEMLCRSIDYLAWGSAGTNVPILSLVGTYVCIRLRCCCCCCCCCCCEIVYRCVFAYLCIYPTPDINAHWRA
jgi:Lung seven transmembrane receptor